jgi:3-oxoacyl-[acyl-carrier protein] reductase
MPVNKPADSEFAGQHVLITGGARGLGFAIAGHFARAGAMLSLFDLDADLLARAAAELRGDGARVATWRVDVSRRDEVEQAVAAAETQAPIDVLVNNAGIARETAFLRIEEREWREILDVNLTGMFFVAQAVCRQMVSRGRGVVINMASKNGLAGESGYAHYNASKGGVIMLTKTMALELAHAGIRVNAICPGYIETPMSRDDVAPAFLFVASRGAAFMTGQVLVLDGGQLAGQKPSADLLRRLTE